MRPRVSYAQRMGVAAAISALLHALVLPLLFALPTPPPPEEAVVVSVRPEIPPRNLIEPSLPAEAPPPETQNIAETDAEAMDTDAEANPDRTPAVDIEDVVEALAMAPVPPEPLPQPESLPVPPAAPAEPAAPSERDVSEESQAPPEQAESRATAESDPEPEPEAPSEPRPAPTRPPRPEPLEATPTPTPPQPERLQVAQARPQVPTGETLQPRTRGRRGRGVQQGPTTNFDAIRSDIAPYLRRIRSAVERRWNEALLLRYSGTSPTEAVVLSEINPNGEVVRVEVLGNPRDMIYAALCADAIRRAGPFGPFPFEVPAIYRNQNLEIRWTFNFL